MYFLVEVFEIMIEIKIPKKPTKMPKIITNPSLPSNPKEIIKIPNPGIKFDKGMGIITNPAKIKINAPIILSATFPIINNSLGRRIFSILVICGEALLTIVARIDLLIVVFENLFGNFGAGRPIII